MEMHKRLSITIKRMNTASLVVRGRVEVVSFEFTYLYSQLALMREREPLPCGTG